MNIEKTKILSATNKWSTDLFSRESNSLKIFFFLNHKSYVQKITYSIKPVVYLKYLFHLFVVLAILYIFQRSIIKLILYTYQGCLSNEHNGTFLCLEILIFDHFRGSFSGKLKVTKEKEWKIFFWKFYILLPYEPL